MRNEPTETVLLDMRVGQCFDGTFRLSQDSTNGHLPAVNCVF